MKESVNDLEQRIRVAALGKMARLFDLPVSSLREQARFGADLKPSIVSDWRYNEFDQILHDIRDVADVNVLRELDTGTLEIRTIADYCDHMVRCYQTKPSAVEAALGASFEEHT